MSYLHQSEFERIRDQKDAEILQAVVDGSQEPCDCEDCDGRWCAWCLAHHFGKPCPFVEEVKQEISGGRKT